MSFLNIPYSFFAGDTVTFRTFIPNKSPTDFSLNWAFRGGSSLDVVAIADQNAFKTTITATQSADLLPGAYYWQAYLSNADLEVFTVRQGQLTVKPSIKSLTQGALPFDGRTERQKMLAAVNKAIQSMMSGGAVQSYSIKGRNLSRMPLTELIGLRDKLKVEVLREQASERIKQGLGDPRRLFVRFGQPDPDSQQFAPVQGLEPSGATDHTQHSIDPDPNSLRSNLGD